MDHFSQPAERFSKDELVSIVGRLMRAEFSESEQRQSLEILKTHFEHPAPSDLIYWPNLVPGFETNDPTPEQVVEFGLGYRRRILAEEELVRLVDAYMHPRQPEDCEQGAYYLLSENLRGFEINHLTSWARQRGLSARQLVERVQKGEVLSDADFRESLAETFRDE